jgi:hypothetical protein
VAHVAAMHGHLPADFDQWDIASKDGYTVAHVAAQGGYLPEGFDQWGMADSTGWAVAHTAAYHELLPVNFSQWGLVDNDGMMTVLRRLLLGGQSDEYLSRWEKGKPLCKADTDWEVFKTELPEIYQKYSISECMLDVDNDQEALQEVLRGALM